MFQLTLPERGATHSAWRGTQTRTVSTHAPRAGSDISDGLSFSYPQVSTHAPRAGSDAVLHLDRIHCTGFNSRSPSGERQQHLERCVHGGGFQLTLPERGATAFGVSISSTSACFNSRSPSGERPALPLKQSGFNPFQLTLPERGATSLTSTPSASRRFNSRSPSGERPLCASAKSS